MNEALDQSLIPKKEKPHVHYGILIILLIIIPIGLFLSREFNSEVVGAITIGAMSSVFSWSLSMVIRCKRNIIVWIFLLLGAGLHAFFIYDPIISEIEDILYYEGYFLDKSIIRVIFYFYSPAIILYVIFMRMKLRTYKPWLKKNSYSS